MRGPDMGGGVGGLLFSSRSGVSKYNLSNGRGDIVAQSDAAGSLTWTASYEAYGKRPKETGTNLDKQRANSKDEDPTGLLNEGFRYRDIETGVWLSRDPAGFVDGPNLYAYVKQNPWTAFDPKGLAASSTSGNGQAQQDGKRAHQEFQDARGGKETQLVTSSAQKVRTDALVITETEASANELKPNSRLENPSKMRAAIDQLTRQMDGLKRHGGAQGKRVVGELWGWTKVNGKFVFNKVKELGKGKGGKIGAAATVLSAGTGEGSVGENLANNLVPNTAKAIDSGNPSVPQMLDATLKDGVNVVDPGLALIFNKQNAESVARGFYNMLDGSGDYADYSQSAKYDHSNFFSELWSQVSGYISGD